MRKEYINTIVEAMHRTKQEVCHRLSHVPGIRITPSEWALLNAVYQAEALSVKAISEKMGVTVSAVSQLLKSLEKENIVERKTDPADKRSALIELTDKSKNMMKAMEDSVSQGMAGMFKALSDEELKTLADLYQKISDSIKK